MKAAGYEVPDPTKPWGPTESEKRLLISVPDKWVMSVLESVALRQSSVGPETPTTDTSET